MASNSKFKFDICPLKGSKFGFGFNYEYYVVQNFTIYSYTLILVAHTRVNFVAAFWNLANWARQSSQICASSIIAINIGCQINFEKAKLFAPVGCPSVHKTRSGFVFPPASHKLANPHGSCLRSPHLRSVVSCFGVGAEPLQ